MENEGIQYGGSQRVARPDEIIGWQVWTGRFLCHCSPLRIMVWKEAEFNE